MTPGEAVEFVYRYHDGTKHHFDRFAKSLGYLDWASQPRPFRAFHGSPTLNLQPAPQAPGDRIEPPPVDYETLAMPSPARLPIAVGPVGYFLRHALGLSAWKAFGNSRWSLRVNPSSGNLHPTEAYVVCDRFEDVLEPAGVWHYAPDRHAIERRCTFDREAWPFGREALLVALTSIHWRESWKYGERAFRYCQHDLGHAVAALAFSAALCGWRTLVLPQWPHRALATLSGVDRDEDYFEAEREEPACLTLVTRGSRDGFPLRASDPAAARFVEAVGRGRWLGQASQLSRDHVRWTFIDEAAAATRDLGPPRGVVPDASPVSPWSAAERRPGAGPQSAETDRTHEAAALVLRRRSALALDPTSSIDRRTFIRMLLRTLPGAGVPFDSLWWAPRVHLALFVHRVSGVVPGLYLLARAPLAVARLRAAFRRDFLWEPIDPGAEAADASADPLPLWLLHAGDYRIASRRLSCDQDIASDGYFSLGMIVDFEGSLAEYGASFYRNLFWESGAVGQVLYLEAEAAGARATGIGCFYDDPVHRLLGLEGRAFQTLYHFAVGRPLEDTRLTSEPGYEWET